MRDTENEIKLIHQLLLHPAGFDIDISGRLLIRQYEYPIWVVEYEDLNGKIHVKEFEKILDAVTFFVFKRYEMNLGLDYL